MDGMTRKGHAHESVQRHQGTVVSEALVEIRQAGHYSVGLHPSDRLGVIQIGIPVVSLGCRDHNEYRKKQYQGEPHAPRGYQRADKIGGLTSQYKKDHRTCNKEKDEGTQIHRMEQMPEACKNGGESDARYDHPGR